MAQLPNLAALFVLRPAVEEDYDFLWRLASVTMREYVHAIWGWDDAWQETRFRSNFAAATWRIIVVAGQSAGGLQAVLRPTEVDLFLANVYLLPEFQNRGIGSGVVQGLLAEAQAQNVPLTLNVLKTNPDALRLYERLGLQVVAENAERVFMSTGKDQS